ncbi:MAG: hypothetical protein WAT71_07570 [Ignavibacteria bacterium]
MVLLKEAEQDLLFIQQKSPTNKSLKATYEMLYYVRMLKYVHKKQFTKIRSTYARFSSQKSLDFLCHKGWLEKRMDSVYSTSDKTLPILKAQGFNTDILPVKISGKGMINELQNTESFIQAMKLENFKALLYPKFGEQKVWLRPDALLVLHDTTNKKYKLTFLEVEAKKSDWFNHILGKREKYLRLAQDIEFYNMWLILAKKLGFPQPDISTLKFSVFIIGSIKKDFGTGFKFINSFGK